MEYAGVMDLSMLEERLKADLRQALRTRDRAAVAVLRTAVAAIDNASSVGLPTESRTKVAGKAPDVPRRELTEEEIVEILRREVEELGTGIAAAHRHGSVDRASELQARRDVLAAYIRA